MLNEDKRRFMRMLLNAKATVFVPEQEMTLSGICIDLSATGLSVSIDSPLEIDTLVDVSINSSSESVQPFNARTHVVRCTQNQSEEYILGLEIVQIN